MSTRTTTYYSAAPQPVKVITVGDELGPTLLLAPHKTAAVQWGKKLLVPSHNCLSPAMALQGRVARRLILVAPDYMRMTSEQVMTLMEAVVTVSTPTTIDEIRTVLKTLINDDTD